MIAPYRTNLPQAYAPSYTQYFPVEYFSGVDCSLFFGEQYIDEITNFEFTLEERVLPVYSYANFTPNRIVHGTRLVQGQFTINMRPGDYLHEMLYTTASKAIGTTPPELTVSRINNTIVSPASGGVEQVMVTGYAEPNPQSDPAAWEAWVAQQQAQYWQQVQALTADPGTVIDHLEYFTNCGFTILMVYGDIDSVDLTRANGRIRTIENVHIFRVGQAIQISGENIMETFGFIASDINQTNRLGL